MRLKSCQAVVQAADSLSRIPGYLPDRAPSLGAAVGEN